jgi:hypothetical protein
MDINKANIANALHSVANEHVVAVADDIYDEEREQYQSEVNKIVGDYEESPEFKEVHLDASSKILYGVQNDGDFYFGAGVPSQIRSYVNSFAPGMDPSFNGVIYYGLNEDPLSEENQQKYVSMTIAGIYQITTLADSHIYFFVPSEITSFYATINGLEVPFTATEVTIDGRSYKKYESTNTYDEATFNIVVQ